MQPLTAVSVTPSSGTGSSQTFSFLFSDPDGYQDIAWTQIMIARGLPMASSCWLFYSRSSNQVFLANDSGAAWLGPLTLGTAGSLQNSQCAVHGAASSVSGSGTSLTLNLAFSFLPAYAGARDISLSVGDATHATGWVKRGSWTVTGAMQPPVALSVTPSSGTGSSQTFSFLLSDPDGYQDIAWTQIMIARGLPMASSCWVFYSRSSNQVFLANDSGAGWLGPLTLGAAGSLQNSQCAVHGAASSVSGSGTSLTLNLAFSFLPAYAGTRQISMSVGDATYATGWVQRGAWTVP
jgi:hypothetical protein